MKFSLFLPVLLAMPFLGLSQQHKEIQFINDTSFENVLAKAGAEHKAIFIDCYATWCGPCKEMDQVVYSNPTIADFFNKNFISVKLQIDQTPKDISEVVDKRKFAKVFWDSNKLAAFPSLLFFDEKGNLTYKTTGYQDTTKFMSIAIQALANKYNKYKAKFQNRDHSTEVVTYLMTEAFKQNDMATAYAVHNDFVQKVADPFKIDNYNMIVQTIKRPSDNGFLWLVNNQDKIDSLFHDRDMAQGALLYEMQKIILDGTLMKAGKNGEPAWPAIKTAFTQMDAKLAERALLLRKVDHYHFRQDWEAWGKSKLDYYDLYYKQFNHNERFYVNNDLFEIFNRCNDKTTLKRAAAWSYIDNTNNDSGADPESMDTYANLLYKGGDTTKAIKWEKKAVADDQKMARANHAQPNPELSKNLMAMQNGLPTWQAK